MNDSYEPKPIPTSGTDLTDLEALIEQLERNAHDIWAQRRLREGWTFGPQRDDREKKHPCLVPYEALPESERELDRDMVTQTLAAAVVLGYRIKRDAAPVISAVPVARPLASVMPLADDDMDDTKEIDFYQSEVANGEAHLQPLLERLNLIQEIVYPAFRNADAVALAFQRKYQRYSFWAVLLGAAAVGLAILQLSGLTAGWLNPDLLVLLELFTGSATIALVLVATANRFKESWLLNRFKAEELRLLKFDYLARVAIWDQGSVAALAIDLRTRVEEVEAHSLSALEEWLLHGATPTILTVPSTIIVPKAFHEFATYYCANRLHAQMKYLAREAANELKKNSRTTILGGLFFFGSVAFVLAHTALDFGSVQAKESWSRGLVALAAMLPALAAAVRTYRAARESARNANRHQATYSVLQRLLHSLKSDPSPTSVLRDIGFSEYVLEADCREWMRLMNEAEWFG